MNAVYASLEQVARSCDTTVETASTAALAVLVARHGTEAAGDPSFLDVLARARADLAPFQQAILDAGIHLRVTDGEIELSGGGGFNDDRLETLRDQFPFLLSQIVDGPDIPLSACSLVTPAAASRLPDPSAPLVRERFERPADTFFACADRDPRAVAVRDRGCTWTYAAFAGRVRAIAGRLQSARCAPGEVVAVTGPRSVHLVAAILAVLGSPQVLLTLDPALPRERRRTMLEHASARTVLFTGGDGEDLAWLEELGLDVIATGLDATNDQRLATNDERLATNDHRPPTNDDRAYIFFTSGSTGTPKAVLGSHNSLGQFLAWQRSTFGIGPGDRCAQLISLSFDAVLRDMLLPLTSGAALHLPDETQDATSGATLAWIKSERITVVHTVPSLAASWLAQAESAAEPDCLRWVFFAGEPLSSGLVEKWRAACPGQGAPGRIVNFYGPTETTFIKCWFVVPDAPAPGTQLLGSAMAGAQALVLGPADRLCGVGEPGEIVIRTPYGSHGYLRAPVEQQARFGSNPFGVDRGDVIYRTGDRGRYRADGSLEILGRLDDELKIRGVRVSPGEVAAAIMQHPAVRQAAVAGERDERGEARLAAYVVPAGSGAFSALDLRTDLARRLPPAFVPSRFAVLDRLPLLPNGKIDVAALPRIGAPVDVQAAAAYVEPETETERCVADEWREVLRVERAGIDDDFFALGGHSLLAAQLLARFRARFAVQLPLRAIFDNPTIRSLARVIAAAPADEAAAGLPDGRTSADELTV